ncbi:MAG: hypothetical protein ACRD9R_02720 [Pyrinomonadaceae bacterium]
MADKGTIHNASADLVEQERVKETEDAAAPDAPTAVEENDGMSTILSGGEPTDGVQQNEGELSE